jgi:hypothetical protein
VGHRLPLKAVGSNPDEFPPDFHWYPDLPLEELAAATFPKLVVSGGHSAGFDAICNDLAKRIGASRKVVESAGHEIQLAGTPINNTLLARWRAIR